MKLFELLKSKFTWLRERWIFSNGERKISRGTTIIELLVAVAIFSITMAEVANIFANAVRNQKRIIERKDLLDNTRYAMEFMTKELRMAQVNSANTALTFKIDSVNAFNNEDFSSAIIFANSSGDTVKYFLSGSKIMRNAVNALAVPPLDTGDQEVSSPEIKITRLDFLINTWKLEGLPLSSLTAPTITIFIKAENLTSTSSLNLQSVVTPRLY